MNEKLLQLESTGNYIFHGSPNSSLEILEPKQSLHELKPDGEPAISGTPYLKLAIFRSLINRLNIDTDYESGFGIVDGKIEMSVSSEDVLDKCKDKKGYVYIFQKEDFTPYNRNGIVNPNAMEWRSYKNLKAIDVVEVYYEDLSVNDIKIVK